MNVDVIIVIGFAVLFHRMAALEHLSAWVWSVSSLGLSFVVMQVRPGVAPLIIAQLGLFGVMWWYNARRVRTRERGWAARREEEGRQQEARMKRAQDEIARERERRGE